jgi:hypothetical protein
MSEKHRCTTTSFRVRGFISRCCLFRASLGIKVAEHRAYTKVVCHSKKKNRRGVYPTRPFRQSPGLYLPPSNHRHPKETSIYLSHLHHRKAGRK